MGLRSIVSPLKKLKKGGKVRRPCLRSLVRRKSKKKKKGREEEADRSWTSALNSATGEGGGEVETHSSRGWGRREGGGGKKKEERVPFLPPRPSQRIVTKQGKRRKRGKRT